MSAGEQRDGGEGLGAIVAELRRGRRLGGSVGDLRGLAAHRHGFGSLLLGFLLFATACVFVSHG